MLGDFNLTLSNVRDVMIASPRNTWCCACADASVMQRASYPRLSDGCGEAAIARKALAMATRARGRSVVPMAGSGCYRKHWAEFPPPPPSHSRARTQILWATMLLPFVIVQYGLPNL